MKKLSQPNALAKSRYNFRKSFSLGVYSFAACRSLHVFSDCSLYRFNALRHVKPSPQRSSGVAYRTPGIDVHSAGSATKKTLSPDLVLNLPALAFFEAAHCITTFIRTASFSDRLWLDGT